MDFDDALRRYRDGSVSELELQAAAADGLVGWPRVRARLLELGTAAETAAEELRRRLASGSS